MALEEIVFDGLALGGRVEVVVEAVFDFPHEEVAGVDLAIHSDLWVRH